MEAASNGTDVRVGGRWSLAQRTKNDLLYLLVTSAVVLAERLPPRLLSRAGAALGALAHALVPSLRGVAEENVAVAFPALDARARKALVSRTYRNLGGHLGEAIAMLDRRRTLEPLPFSPRAREVLFDALTEDRGVVFASAHLGPWERVAATLVHAGLPMTVVAREAYDPRLTALYERLRKGRVPAIYRGAAGAGTAMLRVLKRREILGIPMDLASRVETVDARFLGRTAPTPIGPARLAVRTGAAVVVGTAAPGGVADRAAGGAAQERGLVLTATRIRWSDLAGRPRSDVEALLTARINDELSARIRALPDRWVWMHRRWPG